MQDTFKHTDCVMEILREQAHEIACLGVDVQVYATIRETAGGYVNASYWGCVSHSDGTLVQISDVQSWHEFRAKALAIISPAWDIIHAGG